MSPLELESYNKKLDKIIGALKNNSCILFIGPELMKLRGKSINEAFYESLIDDSDRINIASKKTVKYNAVEKIWNFSSQLIMTDFFEEFSSFLEINRNIEDPFFFKLASIPFPLIVSLIPDDILSAAFAKLDSFRPNQFPFDYQIYPDKEIPQPSKERMLVYNIYGDVREGSYVASHFDYLNFILRYQEKGFPDNFVRAIQKANHLVFIGFEFDKWYNIILLYLLNLLEDNSNNKHAFGGQSPEELYEKLSDSRYLGLDFIRKDGKQFIEDLYNRLTGTDNHNSLLRNILTEEEVIREEIKLTEESMKANLKMQQEIRREETFAFSPVKKAEFKFELGRLEEKYNNLEIRYEELVTQLRDLE